MSTDSPRLHLGGARPVFAALKASLASLWLVQWLWCAHAGLMTPRTGMLHLQFSRTTFNRSCFLSPVAHVLNAQHPVTVIRLLEFFGALSGIALKLQWKIRCGSRKSRSVDTWAVTSIECYCLLALGPMPTLGLSSVYSLMIRAASVSWMVSLESSESFRVPGWGRRQDEFLRFDKAQKENLRR